MGIVKLFPNENNTYRDLHTPFPGLVERRTLIITRSIETLTTLLIIVLGMSTKTQLEFWGHFTQWGLVLTFLTGCLLLIGDYQESKGLNKNDRDMDNNLDNNLVVRDGNEETNSNIQDDLNKTCFILIESCWSMKITITLAFWGLLVPIFMIFPGSRRIKNQSTWDYLYNGTAHTIPLFYLIAEILLGRMLFVPQHICFPSLLALTFLLMDISLAFTLGLPAYPPVLTYHDYYSIPVVFALVLFIFFGFYLGVCITRMKERRLRRILGRLNRRESGDVNIELEAPSL